MNILRRFMPKTRNMAISPDNKANTSSSPKHTLRNLGIAAAATGTFFAGLGLSNHQANSEAEVTATVASGLGYNTDNLNVRGLLSSEVTASLGNDACTLALDTERVGNSEELYTNVTINNDGPQTLYLTQGNTPVQQIVTEFPECVILNYDDIGQDTKQNWKAGDQLATVAGATVSQTDISTFTIEGKRLIAHETYNSLSSDCKSTVYMGIGEYGIIYGLQEYIVGGKKNTTTINGPTNESVNEANLNACN